MFNQDDKHRKGSEASDLRQRAGAAGEAEDAQEKSDSTQGYQQKRRPICFPR
jgi:hypothetical protein